MFSIKNVQLRWKLETLVQVMGFITLFYRYNLILSPVDQQDRCFVIGFSCFFPEFPRITNEAGNGYDPSQGEFPGCGINHG